MDTADILFEKLPNILGLVIAIYATLAISRHWRDLRSSVRGWVMLAFTATLVAFWIAELAVGQTEGWVYEHHLEVSATFIAISIWFAIIAAATGMTYRQYGSVAGFGRWMRNSPANLVTAMGAAAAALTLYAWAAGPAPEDDAAVPVLLLALGYILAAVAAVTWMGVGAIRALSDKDLEMRPRARYLAAAWMGIPITEYVLHFVLDVRLGYEDYNPYSWIMVLLFLVIVRTYSSKEFTAIVVDPEVEDTRRSGFRVYDIPRGVYLLEDDRPQPAFALFSELVTLPLTPDAAIPGGKQGSAADTLEFLIPRGLIVTRTFPEAVRNAHDIHVTPIIWLTESPGERRIAPTSVAVLTDTMTRFMEANPNSIVLLDGVEYLVTFNEFKRVLKALDSLNETTWVTKTRLLIAVDPKAFDPKDLALLERDRKVVRGQADIDVLKRESKANLPEG
ncbi:MAG: DUF835 domain-containing protein [Thermoplasmata archaeon]|nr:DUF835 domain-containing protein [Thermoplasmata archaeon]